MIKQVIPGTKITKYKKSIIDGFYNVYLENGDIMYVNPFKKLIFFGQIYNASGNSITSAEKEKWKAELENKGMLISKEERTNNLLKETSKESIEWNKKLIENGVKVGKNGNSKYKVVTVVSPVCPHCNNLKNYLEKFDNTTYRYYSMHKNSIEIYKELGVKEPEKKLKEQNKIISEKLKGVGVPFGIVLNEKNEVVDTMLGFALGAKDLTAKWDKYLK